jgi:type IV pilus assembly protein PilV
MRRFHPHRSNRDTGFTLIEVMIAIVIFGVGLLAVASLQVVARKANYEAVQRTTAAQLAQGMLERMRANALALEVYVGGGERVIGGGTMAAPGNTCQARAAPCNAAGMATADLWEWERILDGAYEVADGQAVGGLVSPTACIRGEIDGASGTYAVAIAWRGSSESAEPAPDPCGLGNAAYGAADEFRRVIMVQTFINAL